MNKVNKKADVTSRMKPCSVTGHTDTMKTLALEIGHLEADNACPVTHVCTRIHRMG